MPGAAGLPCNKCPISVRTSGVQIRTFRRNDHGYKAKFDAEEGDSGAESEVGCPESDEEEGEGGRQEDSIREESVGSVRQDGCLKNSRSGPTLVA